MSEAEPAPDLQPSAPAAGQEQASEAEATATQQAVPLDTVTPVSPPEAKNVSSPVSVTDVQSTQAPIAENAELIRTTITKQEPSLSEQSPLQALGENIKPSQPPPLDTDSTPTHQPNQSNNGTTQTTSQGFASLPTVASIKSTDNQTQPIYPPSQVTQDSSGAPLPPGIAPMGAYMHPYPGMSMTSSQMRYQLSSDPSKLLSSGRHKKEVKRRTKTGCLTCRKRRIKCDEGHPVCRNCVKSKRECLGYDPVFRPQPTPSTIQPAPNSTPSLVVNPQDPSSYQSALPGYAAASDQSYSTPSQSDSSIARIDPPNYGAPIENSFDPNASTGAMEADQSTIDGNTESGEGNTSTSHPRSSEPLILKAKQVKIQDLLALRGITPPPPHPIVPIQQTRLDEIQAVYLTTYAPAIDLFLETRWFQDKGLSQLLTNAQLMAQFSGLIDAFHDPKLSEIPVQNKLESFEASVVWDMMSICRSAAHLVNGNADSTQEFDLIIAVKRLEVFEALLTGEHLEVNPLSQNPIRQPAADPPSRLADQLQQRALDFWDSIGHFLTLHDNEAISAKELDDTLVRARALLDSRENRDVIYSVAIARHIGQRWADFPRTVPQVTTADEKDAGAKLYVAQKFLEESASGKGTNQVIRRLCGMVVRSWTVSRQ